MEDGFREDVRRVPARRRIVIWRREDCLLCRLSPAARAVELRELARSSNVEQFEARLDSLCDDHLDQLGSALGVRHFGEAAA